jgi:hypothetical protein
MKDSPSTVHSRDRILVITSMLNELLEVVSSDNSCGNDIGKSRHVDFDIRIELCVLLIGQKKVLSRFGFEMLMLPFLMYLPPPSKIHERGSKGVCVYLWCFGVCRVSGDEIGCGRASRSSWDRHKDTWRVSWQYGDQ